MSNLNTHYNVPAIHAEKLNGELAHASGGEILSLLAGSSILPDSVRDGHLLPAVVYGADPYRVGHPSGGHEGVADLLPADAATLGRTLYDDYFNPHGALKSVVESYRIAPPNPVKGRPEHRGKRFHHASYVLDTRQDRYLFTEMSEDDLEQRRAMFEPLAKAYNLGIVAIGSQVVEGKKYLKLPKPGIPAIIREIGQTIMHIPYKEGAKAVLLQEVVRTLEANKSPDYRRLPSAHKTRRSA